MIRYVSAVVIILGIGGLIALWLSRGTAPSGDPDAPSIDSPAGGVATPEPEFYDWPQPSAVLVLTGNSHGYLEPCGCSAKQAGGVARRSDLFKQLRAKDWPVVGLSLGGTVNQTREQSKLKFAAITDAMRMMGYRALGLSVEELRLGPDTMLSKHVTPADGSPGLAFMGSNEVFYQSPELPGGPKRHLIFELGGLKIGVAMVLGKTQQRELYPDGGGSKPVTFISTSQALNKAVAAFKKEETDYNVLLSSARPDRSRELAKEFPQFDLIVSGGGPEDPNGKPVMVGERMMITVGQKAKHAGVLAIYTKDDAKQDATKSGAKEQHEEKEQLHVKFTMVELTEEYFDHDDAMDEVMRAYQASIESHLTEIFADMPVGTAKQPGTYVGAKRCGQCHKAEYEKWRTTRHANAYESLIEGRPHFEGNWVPRIHDPECLACHVTGWHPQEEVPLMSGFLPKEIAQARGQLDRFTHLKGQQCENCHGPGSRHVSVMAQWIQNPDSVEKKEFRAAKGMMHAVLDKSLCIRCHDAENSPEFDFEEYWRKIDHTGL